MKITILTLFPEFFTSFVNTSIIKRAIEKKVVEVECVNYRDFSTDKLKRVDYPPYGGGAGMIISLKPIIDCLKVVRTKESKVYLLSAKGVVFKQEMAHQMAKINHLILICGHYEGVDERILNYIDGEICIGDYILTGGEIGAMAIADSIIRLLDGTISKESTVDESFEKHNLLEYPQYAFPRDYNGDVVPDVLFSGNHQAIDNFRFKESIKKTLKNRPELLDISKFSKKEKKLYDALEDDTLEKEAIQKAHKFMK